MDIEAISHKALRRFVETGNERGVPELIRVRRMIAFLLAAETEDDFRVPPNFGAHMLAGDRAGTWSLIVTRNWRMTFKVNEDGAIVDLDLEDYH
ncbi:MAG: plasmid maintenance system killer [Sphingomonas sp.]|nr:MAG: plasmid maintenance system killer [Sphingomonas sp.]